MGLPALNFTENEIYQINECRKVAKSFRYFLSNYCYIEDKETKGPMLFTLWPAQLRILPLILTAIRLIILKARQLGLTWMCAAYVLWFAMTKPMKLAVVISAKGEWAVEFMERIYFMLNFMPEWLYPKVVKETTEVLKFEHIVKTENGYETVNSTIKSLPTTEAGAQSKTPDILILDETCWNPYVKQIYNASKPGIDAAGGRIIIISNSIKNAPGWGWTRDMFTKAYKKLIDMAFVFMPWQDRPGRPKNFREIQASSEGMDEQSAIEHYPETIEEAISAISGSYFGKTLDRHDRFIREHDIKGTNGYLQRNKVTKDIEFIEDENGIITIWRYPYYLHKDWGGRYWTKRYGAGADISEGLGQSYSVGYIIDRKLDELVARIRTNRLDAVEFAEQLWLLSQWYRSGRKEGGYENALICAERTGAGQTTVKELHKKGANQYVKIIPDRVGNTVSTQLGWSESEQAKHELCGDLKNWFRITKGGFYCPILVDEASTTIKHEGTRKIGPEDNTKFWDCVVAAGCTIQASYFLGGAPEEIKPSLTGWKKELQPKRSVWVT